MHPRDLFDLLVQPTINRVGPLAQLLRWEKYQFFPEVLSAPRPLQYLVNVYYVALKIVAFVFYFVVPAFALIRAYQSAALVGTRWWLASIAVGVATLTLLQIMLWELYYTVTVAKAHVGGKSQIRV